MKKLILLMFVPLLMVLLNSCNPETKEVSKPKLVKTMTSGGLVAEFKYDKDNRLTEFIQLGNDGTVYETVSITYGDKVITIKYDEDTESNMILRLDDEGYVVKTEWKEEGIPLVFNHEYANGKIAKSSFRGITVIEYTWENGNFTKMNSELSEEYVIITYNNVENKQNISINELILGFPELLQFKGITTKNLPVKYSGEDGYDMTFSYTFDKDGYVLSETITYPDSQPTTIIYGYYE